jgi:hypothetical protein
VALRRIGTAQQRRNASIAHVHRRTDTFGRSINAATFSAA